MDYTARYGLEFNPFLKNSKEVLVETQEYKEVLFRLNYLLTTKGFGLLTGSAGRGKTTAVRNWASGLNTSLYKVVYLLWSSIFVTLMANKIGGLQFGIYRNCQISSRVFHTAVAALPLTKANRSDFE